MFNIEVFGINKERKIVSVMAAGSTTSEELGSNEFLHHKSLTGDAKEMLTQTEPEKAKNVDFMLVKYTKVNPA